jgi:hypothetical protein
VCVVGWNDFAKGQEVGPAVFPGTRDGHPATCRRPDRASL